MQKNGIWSTWLELFFQPSTAQGHWLTYVCKEYVIYECTSRILYSTTSYQKKKWKNKLLSLVFTASSIFPVFSTISPAYEIHVDFHG